MFYLRFSYPFVIFYSRQDGELDQCDFCTDIVGRLAAWHTIRLLSIIPMGFEINRKSRWRSRGKQLVYYLNTLNETLKRRHFKNVRTLHEIGPKQFRKIATFNFRKSLLWGNVILTLLLYSEAEGMLVEWCLNCIFNEFQLARGRAQNKFIMLLPTLRL